MIVILFKIFYFLTSALFDLILLINERNNRNNNLKKLMSNLYLNIELHL